MWAFPGAEWPTKEDLSENRIEAWEVAGNKMLTCNKTICQGGTYF